jgi:integrase
MTRQRPNARLYRPQTITVQLIRRIAAAPAPGVEREVYDRVHGLRLRHRPSGNLSLYVQLGRGRAERLCDARLIADPASTWTLGKARVEARRLRVQHADGRDFAEERRSGRAIPTLTRYLEDTYGPWVKANRRAGESTNARIEAAFVDDYGDKKLSELTPAKLETWRTRRRRDGVTNETVNRDLDALRAALSRAVKLEIIAVNPLLGVERAEVDRHKRVRRALTAAEKAVLLAALAARDDKMRAHRANGNEWRRVRGYEFKPAIGRFADVLTPAVIVSLETGMRRNECFSLEWSAVDLDEKVLRVHGTTAKSFETRDIPLSELAYTTLRDWWLVRGQPTKGYVFGEDGERLGNLKKSYYAVLAAAGIKRVNAKGERVDWHSLRHTFGSLLGAANVDAVTLMKLMGHANLETTQRYLHSDEDRKRAAVERLAS